MASRIYQRKDDSGDMSLLVRIGMNGQVITSLWVFLLVGFHLFFKVPKSLHIDESLQYQYTSMSLRGVVEGSYVQSQPPLGNLIQHLFGIFVEPTNFTLRIPSILFALSTAILIQKIFSRYISKLQSVLFTIVIFFNPIVFTYSRYSRSYALSIFLVMLFLYFVLNYKAKTSFMLPLIACLIPWSRTVEGATATVLFWLLMLILRWREIPVRKIAVWTSLVSASLITSLFLALSTGDNYKSNLDFVTILKSLGDRIIMVLELGDSHLSLIDAFAAFTILILLIRFALIKDIELFWIYLTYIVFAIGSPVLIISTSSIPLFPRYIFFYAIVYTANLYIVIYLLAKKVHFTVGVMLMTSLFLFTLNMDNLTRSPFPPFFEAAEYIEANPEKNIYGFLPGDFNQFMAAWPVQPEIASGTIWISTAVKDGGKVPDAIFIFPSVSPSYEVINSNLPSDQVTTSVENLGGGLRVISLEQDAYSKLYELSQLDFHGAELWLKLLGLRISSTEGKSAEVSNWLKQICEFSEKPLSPGTLFGDFSSPQITLGQFLVKSGLPSCPKL